MNRKMIKALKNKYIYVDIDGTIAEYRFNNHVNAKDGTTNGQTMKEIENHIFLYEILRNLFCVAASRGKEEVIFVEPEKDKDFLLSDKTLMTPVKTHIEANPKFDISEMLDFKFDEDVNACYNLIKISPVFRKDVHPIEVKHSDAMIDLAPCIGIYQQANFFDYYDIDSAIAYYMYIAKSIRSSFVPDDNESQRIARSMLAYCKEYIPKRNAIDIAIGDGTSDVIRVKVSVSSFFYYDPETKELFINVSKVPEAKRADINRLLKDSGSFVGDDLVPMTFLQEVFFGKLSLWSMGRYLHYANIMKMSLADIFE